MVLKLFGSPQSKPTLRVAHILKEKQVPFEFIVIDSSAKEHKSPEYLKKQPFGQIPYTDDDGFILFETRAICKYVAAKWRDQGSPLLPDHNDLKATALFDQALSIEYSNFDPIVIEILMEKMYKAKFLGQEPDQAKLAASMEKLGGKLEGYEAILSKQKYLAGDNVTLADLFHLALGSMLAEVADIQLLSDKTKYPNVARWWADISSRSAWLEVQNGI
ncbi:glutathione transferase [Irpex rosettiformis]|uniref:Glutathione transferase n=1 Tax=Irpex rosettiformis TaxID=378272 RepID=A0ACB8UE70_9APHY|nr:glutathione transferase [Irpex rosettiformis]